MRRVEYLRPLYTDRPDRLGRDRLEILTALIGAPSFDPLFRPEIIRIPPGHPVFRWDCAVAGCERSHGSSEVCSVHLAQRAEAKARGITRAEFMSVAQPLEARESVHEVACRICPQRPAEHTDLRLCRRHRSQWRYAESGVDLARWLSEQQPYPGYGRCRVEVCTGLADSPVGLCSGHASRYRSQGSPGGAALPQSWWYRYEQRSQPVPVEYLDERRFRDWCANTPPLPVPGQLNLRGLRPLLQAEIHWGLFMHTQRARHTRWDLGWVQQLVNMCPGRRGELAGRRRPRRLPGVGRAGGQGDPA